MAVRARIHVEVAVADYTVLVNFKIPQVDTNRVGYATNRGLAKMGSKQEMGLG